MGGAYGDQNFIKLWSEGMKRREHLEGLEMDASIMLKCILYK
jgi:hypothetical protein